MAWKIINATVKASSPPYLLAEDTSPSFVKCSEFVAHI